MNLILNVFFVLNVTGSVELTCGTLRHGHGTTAAGNDDLKRSRVWYIGPYFERLRVIFCRPNDKYFGVLDRRLEEGIA